MEYQNLLQENAPKMVAAFVRQFVKQIIRRFLPLIDRGGDWNGTDKEGGFELRIENSSGSPSSTQISLD